jgi:hypothetical protein
MRQIIGSKASAIAVGAVAFWAIVSGIAVNAANVSVSAVQINNAVNASSTLKTACGIILFLLVLRALIARWWEKYNH